MTDAQISHTLSDEQRTASVELRSLAPSYNAEYHDTYVQHLDAVVNDPRNKNVALTGRYGTGKSSVLDRFEELHGSKVLRISITTLGPDRDGEGLTNRIQKELVKQLIYRTKPSELRSSRFARTDSITAKKACLQGASAVAVLGLFLALGGWLPPVATFPDDLTKSLSSVGRVLLFVLEWGLFYAAAAAIASWVRMALESRILTSLSTAGASITLGERDDTYFDTYLDELVTYFDRAGEDYVILEDLDRFDDPAIFDSLRELNSIVNSSPRRSEAAQGRQLCFIYAIKDSLFERLSQPETRQDPGAEQRTGGKSLEAGDAADGWQHSENRQNPASSVRTRNEPFVERANRTKFFDVVIPMVPFLSHRNARDVLDNELAQRNIPAGTVSRALLSLVARHATDMRLLSNTLNEFIVYAQRLLWVDDAAPGLTGDQLFALVAYKNSHLADFEAVPVRKSALDQLDSAHRRLVRHAVASRQERRRRARESVLTESHQGALAERLSRELVGAARATLFHNQPAFRQLAGYQIGDKTFDPADAGTIGFWKTVAENQTIALVPLNGNETYVAGAREMTWEMLQSLFPDAFKEGVWSAELDTAVQRRVETLTAELDFLPGADYADLLERPEFEDEHGRTFADILEVHLPSDIARELVRNRHINRNFATYSAIFYGTFAGIDAETFYYRAVQPNEMMLDHRFDSDDSLRNLLEQLDSDEPDFYQTVSALNPQIVAYLLKHQSDRARQVAGFITTHFDDNAREFMSAYFAEDGVPHASLVDLLAAHPWRGLFDHLASDAVPDNLRLGLIDAALTHATGVADFALGKDIRRYVAENHTQMHAFTVEGQRTKQAEIVRDFACECDVQVEDLAKIAQPLRQLLVGARMYLLTADNLRAALGVQGSVSLDVVANDEAVNTRCLADIDTYLQVSAADPATSYAVEGRETMLSLLSEEHEWSASQLISILEHSSPDSAVLDLSQTAPATWKALAGHHRFVLTVPNLNTYIDQHSIDAELAEHLTSDGAVIEISGELDSVDAGGTGEPAPPRNVRLALKLLNAHEQLEAIDRAALAGQLGVEPSDLPLTEIEPVPDDLFSEALDRGLLEASEEAFDRFATAGWPAVAKALARHDALRPLVTAARMNDALIHGLLEDDAAPTELHDRVLGDFDAFIANRSDEPGLYRAAARRAVKRGAKLDIDHIRQISEHAPDVDTVVPLLATHQGLDGNQLVAILVNLEAPFSLLQTAGEEADTPTGDAAATLFNRLDATGMVKLVKRRTRFRVL